ncbi:hypothetical protein LPJ66_002433 [Kickxella alabastrina]|uniref:Uncharacterized protein n=1 Tax=Kickxella alabastrina TaxID=61397 RepID=A0ACC1IQG5_9FUNG|nr:hypothetical protein LPJ66_002433 [Kickxella alabastrina]
MTFIFSLLADTLRVLCQPLHIFGALGAFFAYKIFYALYLSPFRNIPGPFWSRISDLPALYHELRGVEPELMISRTEKYGSIFIIGPERVGICDPEIAQTLLLSHAYLKDKRYGNIVVFEPNVFLTIDPELNKQRRRQLGPAMTLANLRHMEPAILDVGIKQLHKKWDRDIEQSEDGQKARVCYQHDFMLMSFDIISSLGFGQAHTSLTSGDTRIAKWVHSTLVVMYLQAVMPIFNSGLFRRFIAKSLYDNVDAFISLGTQAVDNRRRYLSTLSTDEDKPKDILQSYIEAEDPKSRIRMTPSQVVTETIINLLAGSDTSSNTLAWTIHLLLLHPQYYSRIVMEVREAFAPGHLINYSDCKASLPFLEACIYEAMRLVPVVTTMPRSMPRGGATFNGHFIPEGYTCSISIPGCNRNSEAWENPHAFYPERFLDSEANRRQMLTFSVGVRVCPGKTLAWMEMLPTLANVLSKYNLELPGDALFTPDRVDKKGLPVLMPGVAAGARVPRFPERDCVVLVSKRS